GLALQLYRVIVQARAAADIMQRLYAAVYAAGASPPELNPLVTTRGGALAAVAAEIVVDDSQLDRRPDRAAPRDASAAAPPDGAANGIVQATKALPLKVPLVIRLTGTNEEQGVQILKQAGFSALTDMDEAVKQAVAQAKAA